MNLTLDGLAIDFGVLFFSPTDESEITGEEEDDKSDLTPRRPIRRQRGAKTSAHIQRPPVRRSARTRRAMNRVFEPSDTEDEKVDEGVDESDATYGDAGIFARTAVAEPRVQKRPRAKGKPRVAATQTSPLLLKQLEREERRRNFF